MQATQTSNEVAPKRTLLESRTIELLGRGYNQEVVANTLGVSAGRISQLLENESIRGEVANIRAERLQETAQHDANMDSAEAKALKQVTQFLGRVQTPMEAARIFATLNAAKRRSRPSESEPTITNNTVVQLTLPTQAITRYSTNDRGQVIEVDGKPVVTLPSHKLEEVARNEFPDQINKQAPKGLIIRSGQTVGPEDI